MEKLGLFGFFVSDEFCPAAEVLETLRFGLHVLSKNRFLFLSLQDVLSAACLCWKHFCVAVDSQQTFKNKSRLLVLKHFGLFSQERSLNEAVLKSQSWVFLLERGPPEGLYGSFWSILVRCKPGSVCWFWCEVRIWRFGPNLTSFHVLVLIFYWQLGFRSRHSGPGSQMVLVWGDVDQEGPVLVPEGLHTAAGLESGQTCRMVDLTPWIYRNQIEPVSFSSQDRFSPNWTRPTRALGRGMCTWVQLTSKPAEGFCRLWAVSVFVLQIWEVFPSLHSCTFSLRCFLRRTVLHIIV